MAILFSDQSYRSAAIFKTLRQFMPDADLRCFPDIGNPADIDYAIIWYPAAGSLQNLPNLKAIFTTSAGVDGIIQDETLPHNIPIIRNTDPGLARGVAEYVTYQVLRFYRKHHIFDAQQKAKIWKQIRQPEPQNCTIGLMGFGAIGQACAHALQPFGFPIRTWSQSRKNIDGIASFAGNNELQKFLSGTDILINILPLTEQTSGILNADLFAALPQGACIINVGRGKHLIEDDLLAALDQHHIEAAALDVFDTEPLPLDHPFWQHPKITMTPHIASITRLDVIAQNVMNIIQAHSQGTPLPAGINRQKQY